MQVLRKSISVFRLKKEKLFREQKYFISKKVYTMQQIPKKDMGFSQIG